VTHRIQHVGAAGCCLDQRQAAVQHTALLLHSEGRVAMTCRCAHIHALHVPFVADDVLQGISCATAV
jgi:hypothetical protein